MSSAKHLLEVLTCWYNLHSKNKTKQKMQKKKKNPNKHTKRSFKELNNLKCHKKCSHSFKMLISYESVSHPLLIKKMNTGREEKLEFLN